MTWVRPSSKCGWFKHTARRSAANAQGFVRPVYEVHNEVRNQPGSGESMIYQFSVLSRQLSVCSCWI